MSDGILLVDKPGGMTSHDVVAKTRRLLSRKDIGHAGTLDPIATGVLVILVGKATKLSDYILNDNKAYQTTLQLGVTTDSDDISGEVLYKKEVTITEDTIRNAISEMQGHLQLVVPTYSAIKVKGQKLYDKARRGEDFTPPTRAMSFWDVQLLGIQGDEVEVSFSCSKGSYVRSWVKTLGEKLGCGATVKTLRRIHSSPYKIENTIHFNDLESLTWDQISESPAWVPLNQTLPHWPMVKIDGLDEKLLSNGQLSRRLERFLEVQYAGLADLRGVKVLSKRSGRLISLLSFEAPLSFKIRRIFPNQ